MIQKSCVNYLIAITDITGLNYMQYQIGPNVKIYDYVMRIYIIDLNLYDCIYYMLR